MSIGIRVYEVVKNYATQPSTWRGIAVVLGVLGINYNPDMLVQISTVVGGAIGIVDILRNENKAKGE